MRAALLPLLILAGVARAEDEWPILVYPAPRAAVAPKLDGALDDACWREAPAGSGFTWYDRQELVRVQTTVRLCWDDAALYVGVWCDEPELDKLQPQQVPHDSKQVFSTEAIEVFIDPTHSLSRYVQVAANLAGSVYDGRGSDPSWDSGAQAAAAKGDGGWGLELAVPWGALEVTPRPGLLLGANVNRDRGVAREWSNWSQTSANFHDPERFAKIVLSPTPEQLEALSPEFRNGGRRGPLQILSREGIGGETYRALAARALARVDAVVGELEAASAKEGEGVRSALAPRLARTAERLAPLRAAAAGELDGGGFSRLELALNDLERELGGALWDARLEALLAGL